jgi:hypothetical protein
MLLSPEPEIQQSAGHTTSGRSSIMQAAFLDEVRVNITPVGLLTADVLLGKNLKRLLAPERRS